MAKKIIRIEVTPSQEELELLFQNRGLIPKHYKIDGMITQDVSLMLVPVDEAQDRSITR